VIRDPIYVAPGNAREKAIADIWAEILGVKRIGVHDNFFDLGGHSLKATQVVSRLRKAFQSDIPLRHMFEFPTIAELAAVIDSQNGRESEKERLHRMPGEIEPLSEYKAQKLLGSKEQR
jgi:acyl carrier protein